MAKISWSLNSFARSKALTNIHPTGLNRSRFVQSVERVKYIYENENNAARRMTLSNQRLFESYLKEQNEYRAVCDIQPAQSNIYMSQFFSALGKTIVMNMNQ